MGASIKPNEVKYVACKPEYRLKYKGMYVGFANEKYDKFGVNCIIKTSNRAIFHIPVVNDTSCGLKIPVNCPIAQLQPIINDEQLFPIDLDEILDNVWETCNVVKKKWATNQIFLDPWLPTMTMNLMKKLSENVLKNMQANCHINIKKN